MERRKFIAALGLAPLWKWLVPEAAHAQGTQREPALPANMPPEMREYLKSLYPTERPARATPPPAETRFEVHTGSPRQTILGLGFEIQCDSIRSGNNGLDTALVSVPHDLIPDERRRLYKEMLTGFRYCRLAGGLYLRGSDPKQKYLAPRWATQFSELSEMISVSGLEGCSLEYWSPLPFWKANRQLPGEVGTPLASDPHNVLRCFGPEFSADGEYQGDVDKFLADFSEACRRDVVTLKAAGIPVSFWGLQNEPFVNSKYSSCTYTPITYPRAFEAVAPAIRKLDAKIKIIADTGLSWRFPFARSVLDDPAKRDLIDALAIHTVGVNSSAIRPTADPSGKPIFNNEFEYLMGPTTPARCLNTVQVIMNWFQLGDAPTWFWLHALKPLQNSEASGYSLGYWRSQEEAAQNVTDDFSDLKPGHWTWNRYNWHAVGSFVRRLPWNSKSVSVSEVDSSDDDLRIMGFLKPNNKLTIVLSNRSFGPHRFKIDTSRPHSTFKGYRYTPEDAGVDCRGTMIGMKEGSDMVVPVPDLAWEFWEEV